MAPFWEWTHAHFYLAAGLVTVAFLCVTKMTCTFFRIFHSPPVTNHIHHHHHHEADDEPETEDTEPEANEEPEEEFGDPDDEYEPRPTLSEPVKQEVPVRRRSRFDRIRSSRT